MHAHMSDWLSEVRKRVAIITAPVVHTNHGRYCGCKECAAEWHRYSDSCGAMGTLAERDAAKLLAVADAAIALVKALPRCCESPCANPGTHGWGDGIWYCDEHSGDDGQYDAPYAHALRALMKLLGLGPSRDGQASDE